MTNLKNYRDRELPLFIVANVLLFLVVHKIIIVDASDPLSAAKILSEVFESVILSAIAFGFILVSECLFTSGFKEKLLYLFGLFNLPGSTIFSKIKNKNPDNRFSFQTVIEKYPQLYIELPKEPKAKYRYENERWYSIYNKCRDISMIHNSQRDWLLCRDIYVSTLLMIIMYATIAALGFIVFNQLYLAFLLVELIITNIGANRKADRFVFNVIAYDLTKPVEKEKK